MPSSRIETTTPRPVYPLFHAGITFISRPLARFCSHIKHFINQKNTRILKILMSFSYSLIHTITHFIFSEYNLHDIHCVDVVLCITTHLLWRKWSDLNKLASCKMRQTFSITTPSLVGIVRRMPAPDGKVWCFLVCDALNYGVCENWNTFAIKQCNFQNNYGAFA